jgi:hypothetical protein
MKLEKLKYSKSSRYHKKIKTGNKSRRKLDDSKNDDKNLMQKITYREEESEARLRQTAL